MVPQVLLLLSAVNVCFAKPDMMRMFQKKGKVYYSTSKDPFFSPGVPESTDGALDEPEVQIPRMMPPMGTMFPESADDGMFSSGVPGTTDVESADLPPAMMERLRTARLRQQRLGRVQMRLSPVVQRRHFRPSRQFQAVTAARQDPSSAYAFLYNTRLQRGGSSHRQETRDARGKVVGSYTIASPDGSYRKVNYVADKGGFRAIVNTNEHGTREGSPAHVQFLRSTN